MFVFVISINYYYKIHCDDKYNNNQSTNKFDIGFAFIITMNDLKIIHCDYKCKTIQTQTKLVLFLHVNIFIFIRKTKKIPIYISDLYMKTPCFLHRITSFLCWDVGCLRLLYDILLLFLMVHQNPVSFHRVIGFFVWEWRTWAGGIGKT